MDVDFVGTGYGVSLNKIIRKRKAGFEDPKDMVADNFYPTSNVRIRVIVEVPPSSSVTVKVMVYVPEDGYW